MSCKKKLVTLPNLSSFSFAKSPSRDLQVTVNKRLSAHAQCRLTMFDLNVWLHIIFCLCVNEIKPRFSPFCDRSWVKIKASRRHSWKSKLGDRMIKQLLNLVIAKYHDLPISRSSIICLIRQITSANNWSAYHWQITIFCSTSSNNC